MKKKKLKIKTQFNIKGFSLLCFFFVFFCFFFCFCFCFLQEWLRFCLFFALRVAYNISSSFNSGHHLLFSSVCLSVCLSYQLLRLNRVACCICLKDIVMITSVLLEEKQTNLHKLFKFLSYFTASSWCRPFFVYCCCCCCLI